MNFLPDDDPVVVALVLAIHGADVGEVTRLVRERPGLASARVGKKDGFRTALHMVTDWPGYFPNGPQTVRVLIDAGADPSAPCSNRLAV